MTRHTLRAIIPALLFILLLSGCDNPADSDSDTSGPVKGSFDITITGEMIKFYSLSEGKELDTAKSNTNEWDFAIAGDGKGFCWIYTNSGDSAADFGTTGQGGVWFSGKTYPNTSFADRVTDFTGENAEYEPYVTDVKRYQYAMMKTAWGNMNIMTYYGYLSGDGLSAETQFGWSIPGPPGDPFYEFNKKAFAYSSGGMPPPWLPTQQAYIIRHADGSSYSKFQVNKLKYKSGYNFIMSFRFENLAAGK